MSSDRLEFIRGLADIRPTRTMKGLKTRIEVVGYPGTGGFSVNGHFIGPRDGEPTPVLAANFVVQEIIMELARQLQRNTDSIVAASAAFDEMEELTGE